MSGTDGNEDPNLSYYSLLRISGDSGLVSKLAQVHHQLMSTVLLLSPTDLRCTGPVEQVVHAAGGQSFHMEQSETGQAK